MMSTMSASRPVDRIVGIAGIARVPFLLLSVVLVASGAAASAYHGTFGLWQTVLALVGLVALHVAVNVLNEISDLRSGIDLETTRTPFSGGSGTLPSGRLGLGTAWLVGVLSLAIGAGVGAWFILLYGWPMALLVIAGVGIVVVYTPVLLRVGVGEVAAGLGLGALPTVGVGLVQGGAVEPAVWALAVPSWCLTFNLLLLNEFPDEVADRAGGRRHLVILLGRRRAALVYVLVTCAAVAGVLVSVLAGWWPAWALLGLVPVVAAGPALRWATRTPDDSVPIPALAGNVLWTLGMHAFVAGGFVLAILSR